MKWARSTICPDSQNSRNSVVGFLRIRSKIFPYDLGKMPIPLHLYGSSAFACRELLAGASGEQNFKTGGELWFGSFLPE